jgi:hypothetical protein
VEPVTGPDHNDTSCSPAPGRGTHKHRAVTTQSKDGVTGFMNRYHIPIHKHNNMDHRCCLTYVAPYTLSIHDSYLSDATNRSVNELTPSTIINTLGSESHTKDPTVSADQEQRIVKCDHGSAFLTSASDIDLMYNRLPPLNLSNFATNCTCPQPQDKFSSTLDHEQPMFTEALSSVSVDWFDYDGLSSNNEHFRAPSLQPSPVIH